MDHQDYWSKTTNWETGEKFESFLNYLRIAHNGNADIDAFIGSEYGNEMARCLEIRFTYEDDACGAAARDYYRSLGLKKEIFEDEDYYTRWVLFTPLEMWDDGSCNTDGVGKLKSCFNKKYPVVFYHHGGGNAIETEEFSLGLNQIAGREKIMVCFLQNTNWENLERVLAVIAAKYPLDMGRVYLSGYSQGGYQVTSAYFRIPEKITAAAPCGNDIYRIWDNFNIPYTVEETKRLKETLVPFMQVVGACEASGFAPVNDWHPRKDWGKVEIAETYGDPRRDDSRDPTRNHKGPRRFSNMPVPPEGEDKHEWMIKRLNMRLDTLGCEPRDMAKCISYLKKPEDELHHVTGFYGDKEEIIRYFGYRHYIINIWNKDGVNAFRYVVVENHPHWPPLMMARLMWDFFKQFRRDSLTGKIVEEAYRG
jgi:hypothetical protein